MTASSPCRRHSRREDRALSRGLRTYAYDLRQTAKDVHLSGLRRPPAWLHRTKLPAGWQSVKVKQLFVYCANRYQHAWLKQIDLGNVDLGKGKRMLVKGGRLDAATQITVPEDLDDVR